MDVATNVWREFLKLIDLHFPPGHILHSVLIRSTVKVSYRCLPNMGAKVAKHNSKLLKSSQGVPLNPLQNATAKKVKSRTALFLGRVTRMG